MSHRKDDYDEEALQHLTDDYDEEALQHLTSTIAPEITEGGHPTEMSQGANDSEKDLHRLTSTIVEKIEEGAMKADSFFSSACIYRVPEDLRKLKESAYTPHLIAIGPLHREDAHLQTPLQHVKMSYTKYLLSRLTTGMEDREFAEQKKFMVLQECLVEMKALIDDVKKCYAAEVTVNEEMMLVDGCFILECLYRQFDTSEEQEKTDPIFGNSFNVSNIDNDLLLLENQIPFFILEKLFQLTVARIPSRCSTSSWLLADYVRESFRNLFTPFLSSKREMRRPAERISSTDSSAKTWCLPSDCVLSIFGTNTPAATTEVQSGNVDHRNPKYYHILHAIRDAYLPRHQIEREKETPNGREYELSMPSASDLVYAGVKVVPGRANNLFKAHFTEPQGPFWWYHSARLEIPPLEIYDSTEIVFRNLIAFEQCCPGVSHHFSSYANLMDVLVKSSKDVQMLEKAGVMSNQVGAIENATDLFNNLVKEVAVFEEDYFADTYTNATEYSKRFWPKNMAYLRRTYFDSPWTFIAFCVGFIVFVMSTISFVHDFRKKG